MTNLLIEELQLFTRPVFSFLVVVNNLRGGKYIIEAEREMHTSCRVCGAGFQILPEDRRFYEKMSVPEPTCCPRCRQQRRAAFRNSRNLYRRECTLSGKPIIAVYSPDKPFKVYDSSVWWSDNWDPLEYGRPFDFQKPFFEQFAALMLEVPRPALFNKGSENSEYTNHAVYNKNCYMCFNAGYCEDTLYASDVAVKCRDCCDLTNVFESEVLYGSVDCERCSFSSFLIQCESCSESAYLFDCRNCHNCLLCWNLRNKSYCIENKQYSKDEYLRAAAALKNGSYAAECRLHERFAGLLEEEALHRAVVNTQAENAAGDYIFQSRNIFQGFDVHNGEDLRYCFDAWDIRDCMDTFQTMDKAELSYETHASSVSVNAKFCNISHENHDVQYTDLCFNSAHLFGCVSLRREEYCILNCRYKPDDYRALCARIIEHMMRTGEYGEFFPVGLSHFGYNETEAQQYYPLNREQALRRGFRWSDYLLPGSGGADFIEAAALPDNLDAGDEVLGLIIRCPESGRMYRVHQKEQEICRKLGVSLPRIHPDVRHARRAGLRNSRTLAAHRCSECGGQIRTSCDPAKKRRIVCEKCYLRLIA